MAGAALTGCGQRNPELLAIDELAETEPQAAIARLDSINSSDLSDSDRLHYDLLTIKARDKAYIAHTSDSLIRDVLDYYESHDSDLRPEDTDDLPLRGNVLSQTGRLLNTLRLYRQAEIYIADVLYVDSILDNKLNLLYNFHLLGNIKFQQKQYEEAELYFKRAYDLATEYYHSEMPFVELYLAATAYKKGNTESALNIIRGVPERINRLAKNTAHTYAAYIYHDAGIYDTAYIYTQFIIKDTITSNRHIGYKLALL